MYVCMLVYTLCTYVCTVHTPCTYVCMCVDMLQWNSSIPDTLGQTTAVVTVEFYSRVEDVPRLILRNGLFGASGT